MWVGLFEITDVGNSPTPGEPQEAGPQPGQAANVSTQPAKWHHIVKNLLEEHTEHMSHLLQWRWPLHEQFVPI